MKDGGANAGVITVAYAITSDGRDIYADMGLVSALSVRITNPGLRIVAVCDAPSARVLRDARHRICEVCDDIVAVETPEGHPTFRNRYVKASLCHYVPGPCLYLDADMLVRRTLDDLPGLVQVFGAVSNNNAAEPTRQIWEGDRDFLRAMGWSATCRPYINGGLQYYHDAAEVRDVYDTWLRLYLNGVKHHQKQGVEGRADNPKINIYWQDQPSLNAAVFLSGVKLSELPSGYNFQVQARKLGVSDAHIWHFWHALDATPNCFITLLAACREVSLKKLRQLVAQAVHHPYPYANQDFIGRRIGWKMENNKEITTFERIWLTDRKAALRFWAGGVKAAMFGGKKK